MAPGRLPPGAVTADGGHGTAVLEIARPPPADRRPHPPPDGLPEQGQGRAQLGQLVLGDLLGLDHDPGQAGVAERAAVEQVPDAARFPRAGAAEVHAGQPAGGDGEAALLGHLALARFPRRLPVRLHDAAWDRPAGLVGGLQDQQPASPVEDQRARGHRDGGEAELIGGAVVGGAVVGGHGCPRYDGRRQGHETPCRARLMTDNRWVEAAEVLARYRPEGEAEVRDVSRVNELVKAAADPWLRSLPLHLTASALVVHPGSGRVLLRWHRRQQAWLQVGGHGDPGESDPLAIALREAGEETGLTDLTPWPDGQLRHVAVVPVP